MMTEDAMLWPGWLGPSPFFGEPLSDSRLPICGRIDRFKPVLRWVFNPTAQTSQKTLGTRACCLRYEVQCPNQLIIMVGMIIYDGQRSEELFAHNDQGQLLIQHKVR
jgi:hypothetical protein